MLFFDEVFNWSFAGTGHLVLNCWIQKHCCRSFPRLKKKKVTGIIFTCFVRHSAMY